MHNTLVERLNKEYRRKNRLKNAVKYVANNIRGITTFAVGLTTLITSAYYVRHLSKLKSEMLDSFFEGENRVILAEARRDFQSCPIGPEKDGLLRIKLDDDEKDFLLKHKIKEWDIALYERVNSMQLRVAAHDLKKNYYLCAGIIASESGGYHYDRDSDTLKVLESKAGAKGVSQFMENTVEHLFNICYSLDPYYRNKRYNNPRLANFLENEVFRCKPLYSKIKRLCKQEISHSVLAEINSCADEIKARKRAAIEKARLNIKLCPAYVDDLGYKGVNNTLVGYNAGPKHVKGDGTVPNFPETQKYVDKVRDKMELIAGMENLLKKEYPLYLRQKEMDAVIQEDLLVYRSAP